MELNNTPNLNLIKNHILKCELCDYKCSEINDLQKHLDSINHKNVNGNEMELIITPLHKKKVKKYLCEKCDFKCKKESDYKRHLNSIKHNKNENNETDNQNKLRCVRCNNQYKTNSGLWKHNKICNSNIINDNFTESKNENIIIQDSSQNEIKVLTNLVLELVKSNHDLQKQMIDVCKNIQPTNSINNSTVNSNNKTFNLQFFLNEQCKDAINIKDFVKSIQIEMADAKRVGKEGYVEGISKLIIEKLKATDIYKRPMHCSDAKRETMYIKENDVWSKDESENNEKMIRFVKDVDNKNYDFLVAYGNANPEVFDIDSKSNIPYLSMVSKSTRDHENVLKVIKKIIKEVIINK